MKKIAKGDEVLMSIEQCVDEYLNVKETIELFDRELWKARENRYEGQKEGLEQGKKEGLELGQKNIAKNLLMKKLILTLYVKLLVYLSKKY